MLRAVSVLVIFLNIEGMFIFLICSPEICTKSSLSGLGAGNHGQCEIWSFWSALSA